MLVIILGGFAIICTIATYYGVEHDKYAKVINKVKKYKSFMEATNQYTVQAIAKEFEEKEEDVENNIKIAIDKKFLKNAYYSRQTKEVIFLKKSGLKDYLNINRKNINVENNVVVNNNSSENNDDNGQEL